ncbi:putative MFS-type transporterc [Vanrija pseudolonga]|uniref:Purtative MFS-type transporterc n=1 Tax=Vanrija pseudolonga TaxID=143232 RepID=A0AAF1BL24_9TREE|nr:purtative MFS-type transporterc [Vanrija pseudolonga]
MASSTAIEVAPGRSAVEERGAGHKVDLLAPESDAPTTAALDDELKLPPTQSLVIILLSSVLMQISSFIVVPSANEYAQLLGGTATFGGLVLGIPVVASLLSVLPMMALDQGRYTRPLHVACGCTVVGMSLYGLAYYANWLYLILIGRLICGIGWTFFMYCKRYCSDPRIVGVRRRTTLAGWQVLGQAVGFSFGPFMGGLMSKINHKSKIFNGFTAPGWIIAAVWAVFWVAVCLCFVDVPKATDAPIPLQPVTPAAVDVEHSADASAAPSATPSATASAAALVPPAPPKHRLTPQQAGVTFTMCWFAMSCFFILGAWEANIPVYTASDAPSNPFHFSPFASGNLIALGGACALPFLLLNLYYARRMQDRHTLVLGTSIGLAGLVIAMAIIATKKVNYGSFFIAWFLVALGFNMATTVTIALLSKQLPGEWNGRISLIIQASIYVGRVAGAVWGGSGVKIGMLGYVGAQIAFVGVGVVLSLTLWNNMKAKTG